MRLFALFTVSAACGLASASADARDPRLREIVYEPFSVVTLPVRRGVVTAIELPVDEAITEVATGLGSDCTKADATWCVATQAGGRTLFVKPKTGAREPNNLAVLTDRRSYAFELVVLPDHDPRPALFRAVVKVAAARASADPKPTLKDLLGTTWTEPFSSTFTVTEDPAHTARVLNADYSIAEGEASEDALPTLVFDDGRFTYLRFAGNLDVPVVFQVLPDGSEAVVNARMEGDLLVVDRVCRHFRLRAGSAVVDVRNEAFDPEGRPPLGGTTVDGLQRVLKAEKPR